MATLLLVLGAGASRNLGKDPPMPLMSDWSNALCDELDERERGLADACRLDRDMDGPTFEANLGLLLRWRAFRSLEERFEKLGANQNWGIPGGVPNARNQTERRMGIVMEVLNDTLCEQFGLKRMDLDLAVTTYSQLLKELDGIELIIATTNYDRIAESALETDGHPTNTGFEIWPGRTPTLKPSGMIDKRGVEIPVIHLHGAVGWYEQSGVVEDHYGDMPYNPTLGTPVVLFPDPDKDPTSDAVVQQLWDEFERATEVADLILVVGHSLHDPALINALRSPLVGDARVAVSYLTKADKEQVATQLPNALSFQMEFGPTIKTSLPLRTLLLGDQG